MPTLELTDEQVMALLQQLPEEQKQRIAELISHSAQPPKRRKFGSAKNDILYMAPDFDAPMEEFEEYT